MSLKKGLTILLALFVVLVGEIYFICSMAAERANENKVASAQVTKEQKEEAPARVLTEEEQIREEFTDIAKNNDKYVNFKDISINKNGDYYSIIVDMKEKITVTGEMSYENYRRACKDIFEDLYNSSHGSKINNIVICMYTDAVNVNTGTTVEATMYKLTLLGTTAKKLDLHSINYKEIENVVDRVFIHPALARELLN